MQACRTGGGTGGRTSNRRLTLAALAVLSMVASAPAEAGRYAVSQRPHWEVGTLDAEMSRACRKHRFNQLVDHRLFIAYGGERGAGVTGVAKRGWNLRDPDGRAAPDATYHFADDGLSTCRVYVAREPATPPASQTRQGR